MWKWIRIPKAVALLAFFLPWMTVSCSGQKLVSATGIGLTFGKFTSNLPTGQGAPAGGSVDIWLVLALVAIAVGLWLTFARQDRNGARAVIATSAAAIVLIWLGTSRFGKSAILAEAAKRGSSGPFDQSAGALIQVDWHFGFWMSLAALASAGVMAWLIYSGRDAMVEQRVRGAVAGAANASTPPEPSEAPERTCGSCGKRFPATTRFCPDDGTALG